MRRGLVLSVGLAVFGAIYFLSAALLALGLVEDALGPYAGGGPGNCSLPVAGNEDGSLVGERSWGWWPPGITCRDLDGKVFRTPPTWRSGALIITLAGAPLLPPAVGVAARKQSSATR
jgi:hypothetical protein